MAQQSGVLPVALPTDVARSGLVGPAPTDGCHLIVLGISGAETGGASSVTVVLRQGWCSGQVIAAATFSAGSEDMKSLDRPAKCNGRLYAQIVGSGIFAGTAHVFF